MITWQGEVCHVIMRRGVVCDDGVWCGMWSCDGVCGMWSRDMEECGMWSSWTAHTWNPYVTYPQGPFGTFHVRQEYGDCEWTGLKFSNDGKKILISTSIGQLKLIDAFQGHELNTLTVS